MKKETTMRAPEDAAREIAIRVGKSERGFVTMAREELRDAFEIQKLTENQSEIVTQALSALGLFAFPHPYFAKRSLRIYDTKHRLGAIALAITAVDDTVDTPLRRAADTFAREENGKDLRSDDVPWIDAFWILLQLVTGRQPGGWTDLKDDRHSSMLARELAESLGLSDGVTDSASMLRIATAVCSVRLRSVAWSAADFIDDPTDATDGTGLAQALTKRDRVAREEHANVLVAAARLIRSHADIPTTRIELGRLGMWRQRDTTNGGDT